MTDTKPRDWRHRVMPDTVARKCATGGCDNPPGWPNPDTPGWDNMCNDCRAHQQHLRDNPHGRGRPDIGKKGGR